MALRVRVKERRTEVIGMLVYLQNTKKYGQELKPPDHMFTMPKKNKVRQEIINVLCRIIKVDLENVELVEVEAAADDCQNSLPQPDRLLQFVTLFETLGSVVFT